MKRTLISRFRYLAPLWLAGTVALACATWICFQLGLNPAATSFVYLIVIVLLSLMDSFISSAVFSVFAVACLNFFFVEPLYVFQVASASDLAMLAAFLITSLVVTGLVRRIQRLARTRGEQAQLLNLTHDSVLIRDMSDVITYWNRGAEDLYGWKSEQAVGRIAHQLLQTVFPAPLEQSPQRSCATGAGKASYSTSRATERRFRSQAVGRCSATSPAGRSGRSRPTTI
jgi:K+-sensing histidine kinase KdpD